MLFFRSLFIIALQRPALVYKNRTARAAQNPSLSPALKLIALEARRLHCLTIQEATCHRRACPEDRVDDENASVKNRDLDAADTAIRSHVLFTKSEESLAEREDVAAARSFDLACSSWSLSARR
jgi:hypothetical protein